MNKLEEIIPVLCLFICVKAQDTSNQHHFNPLHPNIAVVLVVMSIMFSLTFLIVAYAKFCHRPDRSGGLQSFGEIVRSRSRFSGIDRTVIESLPLFQFSSLKGSKEGLECAVCLLTFEDTETLRVLPRCQHAFHMNCIDKWLENHSSCPLCRYKFDLADLRYSNSFRNPHVSIEEPNLEFFVQREQNHEMSSRLSISNTIQNLRRGKGEEPLIQEFTNEEVMCNNKHKIIVSDVLHKSRWSNVNYSDMVSLNTEMLNIISGKRISSTESNSGRFTNELSAREQILKIKEDIERKRLYESKVGNTENSPAESSSSFSNFHKQLVSDRSTVSRSFDPADKRSMSEITNVSRFADFNSTSPANMEADDKITRLWLTTARRTIQWFGGGETSPDAKKHIVN